MAVVEVSSKTVDELRKDGRRLIIYAITLPLSILTYIYIPFSFDDTANNIIKNLICWPYWLISMGWAIQTGFSLWFVAKTVLTPEREV